MPESAGLPPRIVRALQALIQWVSAEQIPYSVIGGVAVAFVAEPRLTQDIDSLVWLDFERWPSFLVSGAQFGFVPRISNALDFATQRRVLLLEHEPSNVNVDISFGAVPFEAELIERGQERAVGTFSVRIPTPEDLIIMKAVAMRSKDILDIERILDLHQQLDLERIRYWVKEFAAVLEQPEILEALERLLARREH
jgi:hypothetical protein